MQNSGPLRFADLPCLVGERICTFLEHGDLLSLRLVCRQTKAWVEAPRILSSLCVDIRRSAHLDRLHRTKRSVNFTNFKIRMEKLASQSYISTDFASTFGPRMKVLKISSTSACSRKIDLLMKCPGLEFVQISDLSLKNISPKDLAVLGQNFQSYRTFILDELTSARESDVAVLISWITSSQNLKHLRLPQIQFEIGYPKIDPAKKKPPPIFNLGDNGVAVRERAPLNDIAKDFCHANVLSPLIHYMKAGTLRLKTVDCVNLCMDINNDPVIFQELESACFHKKVKLTNVPFGLLDCSSHISKTIASCRGLQLGKVDVRNLTAMKELTCSVGFGISNSSPSTINFAKELDFPSLESLDLNIFTMQDDIPRQTVQTLLTTRRISLTKLCVAWNLNSSSVCPISGLQMGQSFPNLVILHLTEWGGDCAEFQNLFLGLQQLQELSIKDCKTLSDDAFCGDLNDISPFRKLTKLRNLRIRCYDNGITGRSLQEAFSLIALRSLSISFVGLSSISIRGLCSLDRLPFKSSIQYLSIQLKSGISYNQVKNVVDQFGNLKKYRID